MISGGSGNDELEGGAGADDLDGGDNDDLASYRNALAAVTASLGAAFLNAGDAAGDTYVGIEGLIGSKFADTLIGDGKSNWLYGGDGNDAIGGLDGIDELFGGTGSDTFAFSVLDLDTKDTVTDFKFGEDTLQLLDVVDGAGSELQDLLDAGINASSSGTTLSIFSGDQLAITINGWTGPQITSIQDLTLALGSSLDVIPA